MSEYTSNITDVDYSQDDDFLIQISQLEEGKLNLNNKLSMKDKEINEHKSKIEDQAITINHHKELLKNNEALISFYKTQAEAQSNNEEDSHETSEQIKRLEMKIITLEEDNIALETIAKQLQRKLNEITNERNELLEMKDKMINMLTDKEMDILELKSKIKNYSCKYHIEEEIIESDTQQDQEGNYYYNNFFSDSNDNETINELKRQYYQLDQEYEDNRRKSELELESMRQENKALRDNDIVNRDTIKDLEYELSKFKEEVLLLELEKEKCQNQSIHLSTAQKHNMEYLNEIDSLRMQIRELNQLNEKIIINTNKQQNIVLSERNQLEELYNEVKREKNELESQLNKLRETTKGDYYNLQEKSMKELNEKNAMINQLQGIISRKDQELSRMGIEKEKIENEYKSRTNALLYKASKFENEKMLKDKKIADISIKAEMERNSLLLKIKELNKELNSITKEYKDNGLIDRDKDSSITLNTIIYREENGNTIIQTPKEELESLRQHIKEKNSIIDTITQEKKYYEKISNELKQNASKSTNDRLIAEKEYLLKNSNALTIQIEALNTQREKEKAYYQKELRTATEEVIKAKVDLAVLSYEKDKEILHYKNYIKTIKLKLKGIGFTMKNKK